MLRSTIKKVPATNKLLLISTNAKRASTGGRTIVRDPRKSKSASSALVGKTNQQHDLNSQVVSTQQQHPISPHVNPPPPFAPSNEQQQSVGSSLASYALAGAGMALGFSLVRLVLGV